MPRQLRQDRILFKVVPLNLVTLMSSRLLPAVAGIRLSPQCLPRLLEHIQLRTSLLALEECLVVRPLRRRLPRPRLLLRHQLPLPQLRQWLRRRLFRPQQPLPRRPPRQFFLQNQNQFLRI